MFKVVNFWHNTATSSFYDKSSPVKVIEVLIDNGITESLYFILLDHFNEWLCWHKYNLPIEHHDDLLETYWDEKANVNKDIAEYMIFSINNKEHDGTWQ